MARMARYWRESRDGRDVIMLTKHNKSFCERKLELYSQGSRRHQAPDEPLYCPYIGKYPDYTEEAAEPSPILMLELRTSLVMIDDYIRQIICCVPKDSDQFASKLNKLQKGNYNLIKK